MCHKSPLTNSTRLPCVFLCAQSYSPGHDTNVLVAMSPPSPVKVCKGAFGVRPRPGLDHIFIRPGPAPPKPRSLPGLLAHTCVETLPHWEPM